MRIRARLSALPWSTLTVVLLGLIGLMPAILMWHWVSTHWISIPYWDEWYTPGHQLESWQRGTLTLQEMFSQHNETRNFFPRLIYLTLAHFGGWDVRKEMRLVFFLVCAMALLLLHLLRRTPGATPVSTLLGWIAMTALCFGPMQVENFLYGIELETLFPGTAVLAAAAINLSALSFRRKTVFNLLLAFVANYTFANGMLLWFLAWPFPSPNETVPRRSRLLWSTLYAGAGALSIGAYFIGYHRPLHHPALASFFARFLELVHYFVLWEGNYFSSALVSPLLLGIGALLLLLGALAWVGLTIYRGSDWRHFYPWLLIAAYACISGTITALGRLGFGVGQALSYRYAAFTLSFYVALVGLLFALYCAHFRTASPATRTFFLTSLGWLGGLAIVCWSFSLQEHVKILEVHRADRVHYLRTLEWMDPIPDNPDLALLMPSISALRERAGYLEKQGVLRLPFVHGALAAAVQKTPPSTDGRQGRIENAAFDQSGHLQVKGWAWLPESNRPADCVVIGAANAAGLYKPISVLETGVSRRDLRDQMQNPRVRRAGFEREIDPANILPGKVTIEGWAIDLRKQKAWPLATPPPGASASP